VAVVRETIHDNVNCAIPTDKIQMNVANNKGLSYCCRFIIIHMLDDADKDKGRIADLMKSCQRNGIELSAKDYQINALRDEIEQLKWVCHTYLFLQFHVD
jgi:hypothetical protein